MAAKAIALASVALAVVALVGWHSAPIAASIRELQERHSQTPSLADRRLRGKGDCAASIDEGGWTLVRHAPGSGRWGPWDDNLAGKASYGVPGDHASEHDWTVPWKEPKQLLLALGDCSQWLIAKPNEVNGDEYENAMRWIVKSSAHEWPYQARWFNRAENSEDPWVSVHDHGPTSMLYGEAGTMWHTALKNQHGGANVYIRNSVPDCAVGIDGGNWTLVRHMKGFGGWGPWDDNLMGTASHGAPGNWSSEYDWTVPWTGAKEFLFSYVDCSQWLIAKQSEVNGEIYAYAERGVVRSSAYDSPYKARWYNREKNAEDPWVSVHDHDPKSMLYGEAGTTWHMATKNEHGGANVYIRRPSSR